MLGIDMIADGITLSNKMQAKRCGARVLCRKSKGKITEIHESEVEMQEIEVKKQN